MSVRYQFRRGTAEMWSSVNPTLASGELGYETDSRKVKIGDGETPWNQLEYLMGGNVYDVAVENGFEGTPEEWLETLTGPQGEQGPVGPPGAIAGVEEVRSEIINEVLATVDFRYIHSQLSPSTSWMINHNLQGYPSVTVVDSGGSVVEGHVTYLSENSVVVDFSSGFSGEAYLS